MRWILFLLLTISFFISARAQENTEKPEKKIKPVEVKISGFIMNNLIFDTRKNVDAIDGMVLLFPLSEAKDSKGDDLNAIPNFSFLSAASRLRFAITGPDALGATTSGYMEYDFTARATHLTATTASLRFRQAWIKLAWDKAELLIGRTWHPLASTDVIPSVMALSIGAPFQPFNRSEQITFTRKFGNTHIILSAIYQNDYTSNGPSGKSYVYQNNALIPNLHAQLKYKSDNVIVGAGFDYKLLKPRTFVESPVDKAKVKTNATVDCYAILAYGQIKSGKLTISSKTILAANTSESLMTGAYGISSFDPLTGHEEYTPFRHYFIWGNISYGGNLKGSLFGGYLKNLGTSKNLVAPTGAAPTVYGLGESIGEMIRITPTVSYTSGKVILAFEIEHNIVSYGVINYGKKGKISNATKVNGTRLVGTMYYNF
jgi:hypothetical protein